MSCQDFDHAAPVGNSTTGRYRDAKHDLGAVIVHPRTVHKTAALKRTIDGPAREAARDLLNIFLCVAAIDAQRMELHQLAGIVLVDARLAWRWSGWRRRGRLRIADCGLRIRVAFFLSHHRGVLIG